jgi:hypothetical protein
MIKIYYPTYSFKIREPEQNKEEVFDELRKLWVRLTPEEWVRQNFIQYLLQVKKYPASYIAVERRMKLAEVNKRFDLLVFDHTARPWLMIECKAPSMKIDSRVIWQAFHYNLAMPVKYLVLTNGETCSAYVKAENDFVEIQALPGYSE